MMSWNLINFVLGEVAGILFLLAMYLIVLIGRGTK